MVGAIRSIVRRFEAMQEVPANRCVCMAPRGECAKLKIVWAGSRAFEPGSLGGQVNLSIGEERKVPSGAYAAARTGRPSSTLLDLAIPITGCPRVSW